MAVTQPASAAACICSVAGGALGGWISDIDVRNNDNKRDVLESLLTIVVLAAILFAISYFAKVDTWGYVTANMGPLSMVGAVVFLAVSAVGATQPHRHFTHSLIGAALWTAAVYATCPPLAVPFGIGIATHIILDLTNKRGVYLFLPVKKGVCLDWCEADGKANAVIGAIGMILTLILAAWFVLRGLGANEDFVQLTSEAVNNPSAFGLSSLQVYLIAINIITFAFCWLDKVRVQFSNYESVADTVFTFIDNALALAGGGVGLLLALITTGLSDRRFDDSAGLVRRGGSGNALWYVYAICVIVAWAVVYLLLQGDVPFLSGVKELGDPAEHVPLLAYLTIINVVAFVLFVIDRENLRKKFSAKELGLMAIAFVGGSAGAMLAMAVTGSKGHQWHMSLGIPVMLAMDSVIVAMLVTSGIA